MVVAPLFDILGIDCPCRMTKVNFISYHNEGETLWILNVSIMKELLPPQREVAKTRFVIKGKYKKTYVCASVERCP